MRCGFCQKQFAQGEAQFCLCPACEARVMGVSPMRREYAWFVAAVRRALFGF